MPAGTVLLPAVLGLLLIASCGAERVLVTYAGLLTDRPNIDPSTVPSAPGTYTTYVVISASNPAMDGQFSFNVSVTPTILDNIAKAKAKGIKFLVGVSGGGFQFPDLLNPGRNSKDAWDPMTVLASRQVKFDPVQNATVTTTDYSAYVNAAVTTLEGLVQGTGTGAVATLQGLANGTSTWPQLDGVDIAYQRFPNNAGPFAMIWCDVLRQLRKRHPYWILTISPNLGDEALPAYRSLYDRCGSVLDWVNLGLAFTYPVQQEKQLRSEQVNQWGLTAEKTTVGLTLDSGHPGYIDAPHAQYLLKVNSLIKGVAVFSSELGAPSNFAFETQMMSTFTASPSPYQSHHAKKKAPVGLIVGVVVGGIAIIALVASVGIWQYRRRKGNPQAPPPAGPGMKPPPLGLDGTPLPAARGLSSPVYRGMAASGCLPGGAKMAAVDAGDADAVVIIPGAPPGVSQGGGKPKGHTVITERSAV